MRKKNTRATETQRLLFPMDGTSVEDRVRQSHVPVRKSTFLAGLSASVHRWFRLTPSFGPDLVQKMLRDMETGTEHTVLDPFSGAGTTLIEAKLEGIRNVGFEINPLLHFVCQTSTRWNLPIDRLVESYRKIEDHFSAERKRLAPKDVVDIGIPLPTIHNVFRWWRQDVLKDILILRDTIERVCQEEPSRSFFQLSLAGVLVPALTNVTLGRLQLHFTNRMDDDIDVWRTYEGHSLRMLEDITSLPDERRLVSSDVLWIDATSDDVLRVKRKIDRVITSPPYPNRYSYVWNTRPHLYLLRMFTNAKQASDLDQKTIGGTWGTATSCLSKGTIEAAYPVVGKEVGPIAEEIRKSDNLMANYLLHYFNCLAGQIVSQNRILADKAKCAYVVGCSRLKGIYVETDVLLGKIFEGLGLGFLVDRIERIRKRHSDKDLHESIVYVSR